MSHTYDRPSGVAESAESRDPKGLPMFDWLVRRLRERSAHTPRHSHDDKTPQLDRTGPATVYISRSGAHTANAAREYPIVAKAVVPVANQRPYTRRSA